MLLWLNDANQKGRHTIKFFSNIQTEHITYKDKTTDVIVQHPVYDLYTNLTMLGLKLCGKYIVSMMPRAQFIHTDMASVISISRN